MPFSLPVKKFAAVTAEASRDPVSGLLAANIRVDSKTAIRSASDPSSPGMPVAEAVWKRLTVGGQLGERWV